MTDNLYNFSLWILTWLRILCDFHHNLMAFDSSHGFILWNKNIGTKTGIIRHCKTKTFAFFIGTNNLLHTSFKHFYNHTFFTSPRCKWRNHYLYLIHMKGIPYFCFWNKDIFFFTLNVYKTKSLWMGRKCSYKLRFFRLGIFSSFRK